MVCHDILGNRPPNSTNRKPTNWEATAPTVGAVGVEAALQTLNHDQPLFSDTSALNTHPFFATPLVDVQQFGQAGFGPLPTQAAEPDVLHVSTVKVCCLFNRLREIEKYVDMSLDSPLPPGEYFKATKTGSMGMALTMRPGVKYLFVMPFSSPMTSYYRTLSRRRSRSESRDVREGASRDTALSTSHVPISSTSSRKRNRSTSPVRQTKKMRDARTEDVQESYTFETFENIMLKEAMPAGKCGLYELLPLINPQKSQIEAIRRRNNVFLVFFPHVTSADIVNPGADSDSCNSLSSAESATPSSSSLAATTLNDSRPTAKRPSVEIPCRCEVARAKALACRELLALTLLKASKSIVGADDDTESSSLSSSFSDMFGKLPASTATLSQLPSNWNFLTILKRFSDRPIKPHAQASSSTTESERSQRHVENKKTADFVIEARLNLINSWGLLDPDKMENAAGRGFIRSQSVGEFIKSLSLPTLTRTKLDVGLAKLGDPSFLNTLFDDLIIAEVDKRLDAMNAEISKSSARVRLLTAVQDVLKTMNRVRSNPTSDGLSGQLHEDEDDGARPWNGGGFGARSLTQSLPAILTELVAESAMLKSLIHTQKVMITMSAALKQASKIFAFCRQIIENE